MDDIERALTDAWRRIAPKLAQNPDELRRRLARRRSALLSHPPRDWCLAVRASDSRLDRCCLDHPDRAHNLGDPPQHQLLITSPDLRRLCAPVYLPKPGLTIDQLARELGVSRAGLLNARVAGLFRCHFVPGPRGRQQPLLYTEKPLSCSNAGFALADPVWADTAAHNICHIPDSLELTLTRVPHYVDVGPSYRDTTHLHPEHPANDPPYRFRKSKALTPNAHHPGPDIMAAYKWKGDQYIGYDWRAAKYNPRIKERYEAHERAKKKSREAQKRRRRENPPPSQSQGSIQFRGWRWLCPACNKSVRILFLPLQRVHLLPLKLPLPGGERTEVRGDRQQRENLALLQRALKADDTESLGPPQTFACEKCHRLKRLSRADKNSWNELVTYLSAGLLFGKEVQRPDWYPKPSIQNPQSKIQNESSSPPHLVTVSPPQPRDRKIAYTPRPTRAPSQRRPHIEQMLLSGKTFKQIAIELGLVKGTILWYAQQIYKQHGVRTLPELLARHNQPIPGQTHLTPEIRRRLLAGESVPAIEQALGVNKMMIYNQRQQLRKHGHRLEDGRKDNRVHHDVQTKKNFEKTEVAP